MSANIIPSIRTTIRKRTRSRPARRAQRLSRCLSRAVPRMARMRHGDRDPRHRPGEVWVEDARGGMHRVVRADIDDRLIQRLAEQVARVSHQGSIANTRCSARRCRAARVCSSAARPQRASTGRWRSAAIAGSTCRSTPMTPAADTASARRAARSAADRLPARSDPSAPHDSRLGWHQHRKTTFLNAMLGEIPGHERVVLVEDTPELKLPGENVVAAKANWERPRLPPTNCCRPRCGYAPTDRARELRGAESVGTARSTPATRAVLDSPRELLRGALEQLLMVMQTRSAHAQRHDRLCGQRNRCDGATRARRKR